MAPPVEPKKTHAVPAANQSNLHVTYKCEKQGRVIYGDQPCSNGSTTLSITATEKTLLPANDNSLEKLRREAAKLEADRLKQGVFSE